MKRTFVLYSQHVGRLIKFHWHVQGKIKVMPTVTERVLKNHGFDVVDVHEYLNPPKSRERSLLRIRCIVVNGFYDKAVPLNENHPEYKREPCLMLGDVNVLVEGLEQAKALTNTVEFNGFPERLTQLKNEVHLSDEIHNEVKKRILLCCALEATQEKLPKIKDPLRPAWVFPRVYGIPDTRKNELLCKNLVMICDQYHQRKNHSVVIEAFFSVPHKVHNKNIQFQMTSEVVVTSSTKLQQMANPSSTYEKSLPELYPLACTIGLKPVKFYTLENIYPFSMRSKYPYIQTAFVHFNHTQVKNESEEPVSESQIQGRSLIKGFTLAAAEARALFGNDVVELPEPVVVPIIQTDGQVFHFTIYQLNTLEIDQKSKVKNIFWNSGGIQLYKMCDYIKGRPTLEEYNPNVIKKIMMFLSLK